MGGKVEPAQGGASAFRSPCGLRRSEWFKSNAGALFDAPTGPL